jgi:hypothetical protein
VSRRDSYRGGSTVIRGEGFIHPKRCFGTGGGRSGTAGGVGPEWEKRKQLARKRRAEKAAREREAFRANQRAMRGLAKLWRQLNRGS